MTGNNGNEFDFTVRVKETTWFVENFIPLGHLCFVLAQAGVGKSLFLEALAVHTILDIDFAGMKTIDGDVLLIDQDTPPNVLAKRLIRLNSALGTDMKHKLFVKSMEGYTLSERTLHHVINDYDSAVLVIVDSFHGSLGKLNPNSTTDMNSLTRFKNECLTSKKTIIFNHHITQKEVMPLDDLMTGDSGHLAMGSSSIMQQADSYYIVGASANNGMTEKMYIRPVAKREAIPSKPIVLRLLQVDNGEKIIYDGTYSQSLNTQIHNDIVALFEATNQDRTVKEVYEALGHKYTEVEVRKTLGELDEAGKVVCGKGKNNLFKYRMI